MRLERLLIGGLQGVEEMLRLPGVVAVEPPVAPEGGGRRQRPRKGSEAVKKGKKETVWAPDLKAKLTSSQ